MTITFDTGISTLLYPFRKFIRKAVYVKVKRTLVDSSIYDLDVYLLDKDKNPIEIPESEEIQNISKLWDEEYFCDFIHNIVGDFLSVNMNCDEIIEKI